MGRAACPPDASACTSPWPPSRTAACAGNSASPRTAPRPRWACRRPRTRPPSRPAGGPRSRPEAASRRGDQAPRGPRAGRGPRGRLRARDGLAGGRVPGLLLAPQEAREVVQKPPVVGQIKLHGGPRQAGRPRAPVGGVAGRSGGRPPEVSFGGEGEIYSYLHRPSILTHTARGGRLRNGYPEVTRRRPKSCRVPPLFHPASPPAPTTAT